MTKEELKKNQFPNDEFLQSAVSQIVDKCTAELEQKISVLLSCKNCPENKGGLLCQKEYEDKCLAQKIQYIKELQEEIKNLKKTYRKQRNKRIDDLQKENAELIQENEEMKKGLGCETCQIHLEYMRLNNKIADLEKESTELKAGRDINVFIKQLTNAKEIISEYINILKGDTKNWKKTQEKAEQFLNSEVEK